MGRKPDPKVWGCLEAPCPFRHTTAADRSGVEWAQAHGKGINMPTATAAKPKKAAPEVPPFTPEHPDGLVRFARSVWPSLRIGTKVVAAVDVYHRGNAIYTDAIIESSNEGTVTLAPYGRNSKRRTWIVAWNQVSGIYWHPDETGEHLVESR